MVDLSTNALTKLDTVKVDLGISLADSTYDDRLRQWINSETSRIERYCNRIFYRDTALVETYPAYGQVFLYPKRTPINSITSISISGSGISTDSYVIRENEQDEGYRIEKAGGWSSTAHVSIDVSQRVVPGTERELITLTYDGGYYTQEQADDGGYDRALPWEIEEACIELVRRIWFRKKRDPGLLNERLGDWSAGYGAPSVAPGIPNDIAHMLDPYRRRGNA